MAGALQAVLAAPNDLSFSVTKTKLDEQKARQKDMPATLITQQMAYKVTVTNRTFKPMTGVTIEYMIFFEDSKFASKERKPQETFQKSSETLADLAANKSVTFETKPVKLETEALDANYVYTDGSSGYAKDRITGIWLKAFVNGQVIGEYASPTSLSKRHVWKN